METCDEFVQFLKSKEISPDDERVPLLKEAWNQALKEVEKELQIVEGADFGLASTLAA